MSDKTTAPSAASNRKSFDEIHAEVKKEIENTEVIRGTWGILKGLVHIGAAIIPLALAAIRNEMQDKK